MMRRLFCLLALFSLLLSAGAFVMAVRSDGVTEGWESKPRPGGMLYRGEGYFSQWAVESGGGRLAFVRYQMWVTPADPPVPGGRYRTTAKPRTGVWQNRRVGTPHPLMIAQAVSRDWRIGGVGEWCELRGIAQWSPPGTYVGVSWLAIAAAGLVLPAALAAWEWWRRKRARVPAFAVIEAGAGGDEAPLADRPRLGWAAKLRAQRRAATD